MNQLRRLRKNQEKNKRKANKVKSLILKICLLLFNFIFATFAWFVSSIILETNVDVNIAAWEVDFKNNQESLANTLQFNVENFYPGMDEQTKEIEIINLGEKKANITYTVEKLQLLGKEYFVRDLLADEPQGEDLPADEPQGGEDIPIDEPLEKEPIPTDPEYTLYQSKTTEDNVTVVRLFNNEEKYPFEILLTYTEVIYSEEDVEKAKEEGNVLSNVGNFEIKLIWGYTITENDVEDEARNELDTLWGYKIANYYNSLEEGDVTQALEMSLKVNARQIIE